MKWTNNIQKWFYLMLFYSQIIGLAAIALIVFYYIHYGGGFCWQSNPIKEFNLHPVLMTVGLIFLYGDAILVYRVFPNTQKIIVKIIHAILLALSLICASVGLKAVFDNHNLTAVPGKNLYSLHSWIGLGTVILFGLQWVTGFIFFLFPRLSEDYRRNYMPSHKFWGRSIFTLAVIAAIAGITEEAQFSKLYENHGSIPQRVALNFFGLLVVIFALFILHLISNPEYERPPETTPEELPLIISRSSSHEINQTEIFNR